MLFATMSTQRETTTAELAADHPLATLRDELKKLRLRSGKPSTREISRLTGKAISHATVSNVLRCVQNPRWGQVELVVEALGGDTETFRPLWVAAEEAQEQALPTDKDASGDVLPVQVGDGTPLTPDERAALVTLLSGSPRQATAVIVATAVAAAAAGSSLPAMLALPMPDWSDPNSVVTYVEKAIASQRYPLFVLTFANALAHTNPGVIAWKLHSWVDTVGNRLGLDQSTLRDVCKSSRDVTSGIRKAPGRQCLKEPSWEGRQPSGCAGTPTTTDKPPGDAVPPVTDISPPATERVWGNVPLRNPNFTGRELLLRQLREELSEHAKASVLPQTLHGFGGVGKTQIAVEYAYRFAQEYDLVWWIPAERRSDVLNSLDELGRHLKVSAIEDLEQRARAVLNRLGVVQYPWLLVYDNAGGPDDLNPFMPSLGSGHVILTSRNVEWATGWRPIDVTVFQRGESIELLHKSNIPITDASAGQLAEKLGDLPLALEQAANFIKTGMGVDLDSSAV